jgi:hypothetical protein
VGLIIWKLHPSPFSSPLCLRSKDVDETSNHSSYPMCIPSALFASIGMFVVVSVPPVPPCPTSTPAAANRKAAPITLSPLPPPSPRLPKIQEKSSQKSQGFV